MRYDVIIVGGGLVGVGLALALRHTSLRIALIDARMPTQDDPRLFALNEGSCHFLNHLGCWDELLPYACPIHQVHVSHAGHFGAVRLKQEDVNLPSLGFVVPAYVIEKVLQQRVDHLPRIKLYRPVSLKSLTQQNGMATLTVEDKGGNEMVMHAPLVIGADGTESTVRSQLGIETTLFDYEQSALVTRTKIKRSHAHVAYERFTADGVIAMLPLNETECATIWTAKTETIMSLMKLGDADFIKRLQETFGYRLGNLQACHTRHTFPLRMVRAKKAFEGCVFLVGNAAHTLHPIAAQGFNLALFEVAVIVDKILAKHAIGESLNEKDFHFINEQIERQQAFSIGVSHRLSHYFNAAKGSLLNTALLQLGMLAFDVALPVKNMFIRSMLGKTKRVPKLLLSQDQW